MIFSFKIAGQEAQRLAGLHRRAREDDARDLLLFQRRDGRGHGEIGLARARRADAEDHVVRLDRLEIGPLPGGLGNDRGPLRRAEDLRVEQFVQARLPPAR